MIHETFTVDGTPDIEVSIESGRVEVTGSDLDQVDVQVDTKQPGFVVEQRGNSILVSSDKDSWLSRGSAFVLIATPIGSNLDVKVASAQIDAQIDLGRVDVKTASGDVEMQRVDALDVKTASGDLELVGVERSLRFISASGDLRVTDRVSGSVEISTASGDIHIEECDASVDVKTASGDSHIASFSGRSATFKAMSGTIDLAIPSRTDVDLDVNLLSGRLRVPDPEPRTEPAVRQMSIRAKLVSGDLNIRRA